MSSSNKREKCCLNATARLRNRETFGCPPGSQVTQCRKFYENIVPNEREEVEAPDFHICRFLPSGRLVGVSMLLRELLILSYICVPQRPSPAEERQDEIPFSRCFHLDQRIYFSGPEHICKDFCLVAHEEQFLIVASCCTPISSPALSSETPSLPLVSSTVFYAVDSYSGKICDSYQIKDDFIQLSHAHNVFLLDDILCVLAIRSQTLHILQISDVGKFLPSHKLGLTCLDDDDLILEQYELAERQWQGREVPASALSISHAFGSLQGPDIQHAGRARAAMQEQDSSPPLHRSDRGVSWAGMIVGIRQKLLTYIFLHELPSSEFYKHFNELANLIMWKAQFLDRRHLLISMGPQDAWLQRDSGSPVAQSYCLFLWSLQKGKIVRMWNYDSNKLLEGFQRHWQYFHPGCIISPWHAFLSAPLSCSTHLPPSSSPQAVRRLLSNLPTTSQSQSPSPYLDNRLFQYDDKLISPLVRPRPYIEALPVKFSIRSVPGAQSFRIQTASGHASNANSERYARHIIHYHFHPLLPLILCLIQKTNSTDRLTIFCKRSGSHAQK